MLFPSKHDNPDQTVLAVSCIMIKYLQRYKVVKYQALLDHCKDRAQRIEYLFTPSISLLFLLDLVRYLPKSDSFEWRG